MGRRGLPPAGRAGLFQGRHDDVPGGERDLSPRDLRQLSGRPRHPAGGVRRPAASDRSRAHRGVALLHQDPALAGGRGDDPLAVRLDAGSQQGRAAAGERAAGADQEGRHSRRGLHGRRHRLGQRAGRHRGRADRPRPGERRQGQGACAEGPDRPGQQGPRHRGAARRRAGAHHRDRRLRGARRRRPHRRGGVRGSQGEGRGHRQGAGGGARCDLRLQHLDPADHVARRERQGPGEVHRHPLLLAGRAHDAGRDHHGQENRRRGAGAGARFRPRDPQDPDRRQRFARLLHLARGRHLSARRPSDAGRRNSARR